MSQIFRLYIVFIRLCAIRPSIAVVTCLWWTIHLYAIVLTDITANGQTSSFLCMFSFTATWKCGLSSWCFPWQQHYHSTNVLPAPEFSNVFFTIVAKSDRLVTRSKFVNMLAGTQILHSLVLMTFFLFIFFHDYKYAITSLVLEETNLIYNDIVFPTWFMVRLMCQGLPETLTNKWHLYYSMPIDLFMFYIRHLKNDFFVKK